MDVDIAVVGHASEFWEARRLSIDFPLYSKDNQEWFSAKFSVWQDTWNLVFVFDLSSLVSTNMPLPADILRDYTPEFKIRVERAFTDLRKCLREVFRDRDYCREIANTLMRDIGEMSSMQKSELATLRAELNRRGPAPLGTEEEYAQLRSWVTCLEDVLAALTRIFASLDHTWDEEKVALKVGKAVANSRVDDLALELLQARSYIHSALYMEYGQEGDERSEA